MHAGSDLRRRTIVLDSGLRGGELRRILVHELFHFVWPRLGNPARRSWGAVLSAEFAKRARGDLGWAAESRKAALGPEDPRNRTAAWRAYACEAFCDTAAYLWSGVERHPEFTLAASHRSTRARWMRNHLGSGRIKL